MVGDVWIFDHSSCHNTMADDALDVTKMNANPDSAQRVMRDTVWVQKMNFALGVPKGMHQVLEKREINTWTLKADEMRKILLHDFRNENEQVLTKKGHIPSFSRNSIWNLIRLSVYGYN